MNVCQTAGLQACVIFLLMYFAASRETGTSAIKDEAAFIPCNAFISAKRFPGIVTLIQWLRSSFHKPVYTLDLRSINSSISMDSSFIHKGRHFPSPETEGRLYLDLTLDPIILRIDPVSPEDAGVYTCRIDFRKRRSVFSNFELKVIIPPKEAVIRNSKGQKVEGVIGPFLIGQSVKLICDSLGGQPVPVAIWRTNVEDYQRVTINGSILTIHSLQRYDQWSHYTCTVQNTNMTAPKSVTVIIELILPPMELLLHSNAHRPFTSGQRVQISCQSFGSYPKAHVYWKKDNESLESDERVTNNGNVTTSFIELVARPLDDGKEVECMAFNPDLKDHILRRTFVIRVHYKPEVHIAMLSNQSQLSEGNSLVLLCNVKANPEAYRVIWMFDDQEIFNNTSVTTVQKFLYIKYLERNHTGYFQCVATNDKGEQSASVRIAVKHRPVCQESELSYNYGLETHEVNVSCNLASYPADVTFYWMVRNSSSNHSWSTGAVPYTRVELQKSGSELLCWGRNEIGGQMVPCRIFLVPESEKSFFYLHILLITSCVLLICFIVIYILSRRYKDKYNLNSTSYETEMSHLKDHSCGRLITKCVNPSISNAESDCSTNLLDPDKRYSDSPKSDVSTS